MRRNGTYFHLFHMHKSQIPFLKELLLVLEVSAAKTSIKGYVG